MIETPKDGRIQVEKLKYPVEVLAYKLWLDPELVSRVDLKRMYTCQLYASNSSKYVSSLSSSKLPRNSTLVGKSWKTHPEISVFWSVTQTDFWKTHPVFFPGFPG